MNNQDPLRDYLQVFFRLGAFVGFTGLLLAFFQPTDSGEFVLSVCSAAIGGVLMLGVAVVTRFMNRRTRFDESGDANTWRD